MTSPNTKESNNSDADTAQAPSQKELRTEAFRIAVEMVAVFGGTAVVALVAGGWLENQYSLPAWTTYALLAVAFISSWVIVYLRVRSFARDLDATKQEVQKEKRSQQNSQH